jgi:hypothetical protein
MSDEKRKVFISYSVKDREFAEKLAAAISERGAEPSLSEHGRIAKIDWLGDLRKKLGNSDAVVLVMPSASAPSANSAFFEAGAARALGKDVIVVIPDRATVDQDNIPLDVATTVVLDASKKPVSSVATTVLDAAA